MATRETSTASTEPSEEIPSVEPPGKLPKMISNSVVRVDKGIGPRLTAEQHHDLIRVTAYHLAERRGFEPEHQDDDWATAETLVVRSHGLPVI